MYRIVYWLVQADASGMKIRSASRGTWRLTALLGQESLHWQLFARRRLEYVRQDRQVPLLSGYASGRGPGTCLPSPLVAEGGNLQSDPGARRIAMTRLYLLQDASA